jgi:hypothetical protein
MSHSLEIVPGTSIAHVRDRVIYRKGGVNSVLTPFVGLTLHGMAIRRAAKLIYSTLTCGNVSDHRLLALYSFRGFHHVRLFTGVVWI